MGFDEVAEYLRGKRVAIVGSGPSVLTNALGFVDAHEIVVRVNNYRTGAAQGTRCDVFYSFFGHSIRKTAAELRRDGVRLLLNKCPNGRPLQSAWHERNGRLNGIDFRYIYELRKDFWFGDVFVPDAERFLRKFRLLCGHIPTTGFAAILDVLDCAPESIFLTGFDFMTSGVHNVNERWRPGDPNDPIGHRPELEADWVAANAERFTFDAKMSALIEARRMVAA